MKLYLLSQDVNDEWDTYDSCVVCAEDEDDARRVHPSSDVTHNRDGIWYGTCSWSGCEDDEYENEDENEYAYENGYASWVPFTKIADIKVTLLGEADESTPHGVVCSSFNAG